MKYYIIANKIYGYEFEFDSNLYDYQLLTSGQSAFYEANPNASISEILATQLNEVVFSTPILSEVKKGKIQYYSQVAFEKRELIYPDYKLINASLGLYDETESANIKRIVEEFRAEFYRLKTLVESATTITEIELITDNYNEIN